MLTARRPLGRLFYLLLTLGLTLAGAQAQGPTTTTVSDVVYRADGTPAAGTLLISWPAFSTGSGQAVAAGTTSVTLGSGGTLSVALVPNAGATPAGTVYVVVYQLNDGTVKTEYWLVPTSSPTTIAAVRTVLGGAGSATQIASQQYVNSVVASKANDTAVVHLSGSETVSGAKQFAVAPSVPTPTQATDAVNKAYVDAAVSTSGGGTFVSKAGDTMTGALTLAGDPTAPNQAASRHYVDTGLAAKADVIAGLVPATELGTGTASSATCLVGNGTWGPCGSSSNAIQIQSVPVDTAAPSDNQVITYVASLGKYQPRAGGGVTAGMQAVKYSVDFNWSQTAAADLTTAGVKTVSLAACPLGVKGSEPSYYVYISGTGTAEAVLVTGGTCAGNGAAGTLQFTTVNSHASGYTVGSASSGLQESIIGARIVPANPTDIPQAGSVVVPPGELNLYAPVAIRSSDVTIDFSGSIVNCWMNDTCIFVGGGGAGIDYFDITLVSPRGRPMVVGGQHPFIEVNAQKTRIYNVSTRIAPTGATFSSYVQVDDDQAFLLDGLDTSLGQTTGSSGVLCNATACNPVIYAPGPLSSNAAVGWLKHLNIGMQCTGNGVDWQSGNSLRISDSVIQGANQYAVRTGLARGGFSGTVLDNVYEEIGGCANPLGAIGAAGVIAEGGKVTFKGNVAPSGFFPLYANTGTTPYRYYVVARSATLGPSNVMQVGTAMTNGSGNITVTTPDVAGADSFDLLRVTDPATGSIQGPYGTGNYAVATGVTRSSACASGVCTFTDTQAALTSYTVATPTYFPLLTMWPGPVVLGSSGDSNAAGNAAILYLEDTRFNGALVTAELGTLGPAVISAACIEGSPETWTSCLAQPFPSHVPTSLATILFTKPNQDGGLSLNQKGRLNMATLGSGPSHIITLSDSNFQKTVATANHRPSNDASDAYIGYDRGTGNPTQIGISFGAPLSLSNYIGNVGDGTNWLERLTSVLKEFKTNVQMDGTLTVAGQLQANSFVWAGSGAWSVLAGFGTLSAAPAGKSAIGFGAGGKLQVSENGGSVVEVAKLDSSGNVSENANTATALAATPTQCNGSFATGIQANGNANCGTADLVQLAETTPPTGIANFGLFWFDTTCHCPKVISNNGQAVQLGLTNLFNADANTLEERNGATAQTLSVYGTYTDASNYERVGLHFNTTDGFFVVDSGAAGTGVQRGLGFTLQGSMRWVIDSGFNFKPWSDNVKDVGSATLRPKHIYVGTYVDLTGGAAVSDVPNEGTTGTTLNKLAKVSGAPSTAVIAATSDTSGVVGVVVDNAGTTGSAQIARGGQASCVFDGATTAGDYVQISGTTAGDCHDAGAAYPTSGQVLGRVLSTNGGGGTYAMLVAGAEVQAAAPINSPGFAGTPTAPTPSTSDNSTKIATTAYVQAQGFVPSDSTPWFTQPSATGTVSFLTTANTVKLFGVVYPGSTALVTTKVNYNVVTADNTSNTYDIGILNSSGQVVAHIGATAGTTFAASTGWKTLNWTGSATLTRGKYYLAITTNCTTSCAQIIGSSTGVGLTFVGGIQESVSSGGTLSGTITIPADAYTATTIPTWAVQ